MAAEALTRRFVPVAFSAEVTVWRAKLWQIGPMLPRCLRVILFGCAAACAPANQQQRVQSSDARDRPANESFNPSSGRSSVDEGTARHTESGARHSSEPPIAGDAVDLSDFCAQHGIEASLNVERCVATALGPHPSDMLWCSRREELDDVRVAYYLSLFRVQAKRLQKVIELNYAAGPRPMEGRESDSTYYVKLSTVVADDGKTFELKDEAGLGCDDGLKSVHEEYSNNPSQEQAIAQLVTKICMSRGRYSAQGQRLK